MKVRLLKDWSFQKAGTIVEIFEPTGRNWILNGIAAPHEESRSREPEEAVAAETAVEHAAVGKKYQHPRR